MLYWTIYLSGFVLVLMGALTLRQMKIIEDGPDNGVPWHQVLVVPGIAALWPIWLSLAIVARAVLSWRHP